MVLSLGQTMRRREFITGTAVSTLGWPLLVRAQQDRLPAVGFLNAASAGERPHVVEAFRAGLAEGGFLDGRTVTIHYRFADNQPERLPDLAVELVRSGSNVIVVTGGLFAVRAAKQATNSIPIVFVMGSDPVETGIVASFNRPGANVTGVSFLTDALGAKRLGLLREVMPKPGLIAVLINPKGPDAERQLKELPQAANAVAQPIKILRASTDGEITAAFDAISQSQPAALLVGADPFFNDRRNRIVRLAARPHLPAIYELREFPAVGGLMSYGTNLADAYRQGGAYAARILKGAHPADMPVIQPTKFELVINTKTAKEIAVELPATLLARADEVIE